MRRLNKKCPAGYTGHFYLLVFIFRETNIYDVGAKGILTPMIHGLLRISCSRNPKTPQIRSFFYEKWLLFGIYL